MKKIFITCLLSAICTLTTFAVDYSGTCGTNLTWELTDGVLTISGTGDMENYSTSGTTPWYSYRSSISEVLIADGVTNIGKAAFLNCDNLASVVIPNSITSIGEYAFRYCHSLTSVEIPNSVISIGYRAFNECTSLESVNISDISAWCKIMFGADANPLYYAHNLYLNGILVTDLVIPNSVVSIGYAAFWGCSSLASVTIPNSVTSIGNSAFGGCIGLTSVEIPNSVTSIGDGAFYGCNGLTSMEIPNSVTNIGEQAFYNCSSLTSITIPNSVTNIGNSAFRNCSNLVSVVIPNSVTSIGEYVFRGCRSLTSVMIPNSITNIEYEAFRECSSLTSLMLPNSVSNIGGRAFYECSSLATLYLGENITQYGNETFSGCSSLKSIYNYREYPATLGTNVFSGVDYFMCTLYVPSESAVQMYSSVNSSWKNYFYSIKVMEQQSEDTTAGEYNVSYIDAESDLVSSETITLHVPNAPMIIGYTFLRWETVAADIESGITIQAVYEADEPASAPEVYTIPNNPAQKLIKNGNVYILQGDKKYTLQGQEIK